MLQVLLLILKILLWVILGLLGLVLLLLLLVLFAPIKYEVDAKYYGTAKVKAKVSFLIVSIRVCFDQETKEFTNVTRVLGIPLKQKKKDKPKKKEDVFEDVSSVEDEFSFDEELIEDVSRVNAQISEENKQKSEPNQDVTTKETADDALLNEEFDLWDNEDKVIPEEEKKLVVRIKIFFKKLWDKLVAIKDLLVHLNPDTISEAINKKTAKLRRTVNRFKQFWNMKCTIKTRSYLKKYIVSVLKHIAPKKVKGYIHFGMEEPYKTGQIIGYLSMIPFVYQKHLVWEPDFYNKIIEGDLYLKGKVRIGYIARIVLKIHIWKTIKMATKIMK